MLLLIGVHVVAGLAEVPPVRRLLVELVDVPIAELLERRDVERVERLDGQRDVDDRLRGEPRDGRRADVLDLAKLRSQGGADLIGLRREPRRPGVVVLDDSTLTRV